MLSPWPLCCDLLGDPNNRKQAACWVLAAAAVRPALRRQPGGLLRSGHTAALPLPTPHHVFLALPPVTHTAPLSLSAASCASRAGATLKATGCATRSGARLGQVGGELRMGGWVGGWSGWSSVWVSLPA